MKVVNTIRLILFGTAFLFAHVSQLPAAESLGRGSLLAIPIGQAVPISDLTKAEFTRICVLTAYQDRLVVDNDDTDLARANAYLSLINYSSDEGHWALVLIKDEIELIGFKRSAELDLMAEHETRSSGVNQLLPPGFQPMNCATGEHAAMSKIVFRERAYVVLGELR